MRTEKQPPGTGFEESYRQHRLGLLRSAYLMSGSQDASEDAVQTVFTSAHDRWDQIQDPLPYLERRRRVRRPGGGVELVNESRNLLSSEWSSSVHEYGEPVESDCGGIVYDATRFLGDPTLYSSSDQEVGNSFVCMLDVHPDVTAVRITSDADVQDLEVDGAGYAPFAIPDDLDEYTSELVIDGQVVPGSAKEQTVPDIR